MKLRFTKNLDRQRGVVVPLAALSFVVTLILIGLVVDAGRMMLSQRRFQWAVDAATVSNAYMLGTRDTSSIENSARQQIVSNLAAAGIEISPEDITPSAVNNLQDTSISVTGTLNVPLSFMRLLPALPESMPVNALASAGRPPLNVMLVLDRSSSMEGEKLEKMKEAAIAFVSQLNENLDRVGVVAYAKTAVVLHSLGDPFIKEDVIDEIEEIEITGWTCIGCGLKAGIDDLTSNSSDASFRFMVLLTDGRPTRNADPEWELENCHFPTIEGNPDSDDHPNKSAYMEALVQANRAKVLGLVLYTVGFGEPTIYCDSPGDPAGCGPCYNPPTNPWGQEGGVDCNEDMIGSISQVLLAEGANDPQTFVEYEMEFPGPMPTLEFCDDPANSAEERVEGLCGCLQRVGDDYPQGLFLAAPEPEDLAATFNAIRNDALNRTRLRE